MTRIALTVIALLSSLSATAVAQDTASAALSVARKKAGLLRSLEGEERGRVEQEVLTLLRSIPERFPEDQPAIAAAWLELASVERLRGDMTRSREALEKAVTFTSVPRVACEALHDLASLHAREKRPADAIACLERIVQEFRDQARPRAQALIRLSGQYERKGDLAQCEAALRRCLDEHADQWSASIDALDRLAMLKLRNGYRDEATELLKTTGEALKTRFSATNDAARVEVAYSKMKIHALLARGRSDGR